MEHDHEQMLVLGQAHQSHAKVRWCDEIERRLRHPYHKSVGLHATLRLQKRAEILLFEDELDMVMHILQNRPVVLDEPGPQDFMPCNHLFECPRQAGLVELPLEVQHFHDIERGRAGLDFIYDPESALLSGGCSEFLPHCKIKQGSLHSDPKYES